MAKSDIVEYDGKKMATPAFDLIVGFETLRELGIVLDFQTKNTTIDEIILPMRDITSLSTRSNFEKAWSVNQSMISEPQSTEKSTQHAICIIDAKYGKADLQSVVYTNCPCLSLPDQNKLLDILTKYEDLFDGTQGDWNNEPVSIELEEGVKFYHGRAYTVHTGHSKTLRKN